MNTLHHVNVDCLWLKILYSVCFPSAINIPLSVQILQNYKPSSNRNIVLFSKLFFLYRFEFEPPHMNSVRSSFIHSQSL
jgi:hypothetical protein